MSILIFLIVLSVLVVVHEFGHFIIARWCGVHVHEFGLGFPPKAAKLFRWKETVFTLNWLPFGGFVRMEGEDTVDDSPYSFNAKHPAQKLAILFAGIFFNILFAWALISITLGIGVPMSASVVPDSSAASAQTVVMDVVPGSPAANAGIVPGVILTTITTADGTIYEAIPDAITTIVTQHAGQTLAITSLAQDGTQTVHTVTSAYDAASETYRIGLATDRIVFEQFSFFKAIGNGFVITARLTKEVAVGLVSLIGGIFTGTADTDSVTGPVGLVDIVGTASKTGIVSLLILTAVISINLAIINLVPLPALDGGRIIVTLIEWIRGKQFNQKAIGIVHTIGFFLLIGVLILVTIKDIKGLF